MNAKRVRDFIGNELWTANMTGKVKLNEFALLDKAFSKLSDAEDRLDMKELCLAELKEGAKNPIAPRYMATLCGKHPMDDQYAFSIFEEYYRDSRWDEVIFIGKKLLSFSETSYVLKALADTYERVGKQDEKLACWERLIRVDHAETDVFYQIASHYEKAGDTQKALSYYKRVIQRHINAKEFEEVRDAWEKVIVLEGENTDYLLQIATRVAKVIGADAGFELLELGLTQCKPELANQIRIVKKELELAPQNKNTVERLVSLYRLRYAENPRLEYCLSDTGLVHSYMDAVTAVNKFESEIEFVEGAFVLHTTWGLGRIKSISKDDMKIQFLKKKELHPMGLAMGYSSLKILPKQHILVLKAGAPAQKIREKVMADTTWGLRMLLNSFNGKATLKQMKAELVPSILSDADWTAWQSAAKKELSQNPYFSTSDEGNDIYVLRDTPITFEEKTLLIFQREKGFFNKYNLVKDFVKKNGSTDSEEFAKILSYFEGETKGNGASAICSYMVLQEYAPVFDVQQFVDKFTSMSVQQLSSVYGEITDSDLRHRFIDFTIANCQNAVEILISLLHVHPSNKIKDSIKENSRKFNSILTSTMDNYAADPDLTLFFFKNCTDEEWAKAGFDSESRLYTKLQLLISVSGKVAHDVQASENKPRLKALCDMLFSDQEIVNFLKVCDTQSAKRVYSFVSNVPGLDEDKTIGIKHFILKNRKDADEIFSKKDNAEENIRLIPKGFLCTKAMLEAKTAELEHIMSVEIPENSKEIGIARDLGDLRENAEYQYAKDKQKNLNFMMNKLTDELDIAKLVNPEDVDVNYVEFGTTVVLTDNINKTDVTYTVFGPWESNPEKNILNFQAPLGQKIYNMMLGQNKKFEINGVKYDLTVKSIVLADFNL